MNNKQWTPEEIKALRKRLNLYQKDFAALLRVTREYVVYLERGVKTASGSLRALMDCLEEKHSDKKTKKKGV